MLTGQPQDLTLLSPGNILKQEGDFARDVVVGIGNSNIALCTLWSTKETYRQQLAHVGVIGNLYFRLGIGILIRNVLATPEINHILVTGKDCPEPKQQQAEAILTGEFDPLAEPQLTPELVAEFYNRVKLIDARHIGVREQDELTNFIKSIASHISPNGSKKSILVPLEVPLTKRFPTSRSGHVIRASSIHEAHLLLLHEIRTFGEITQPDDRERRRQELWQMTVCLNDRFNIGEIPHYSQEEVKRYADAMWNGDEPEGLTYRYGYTIRHQYGDQLNAVLNAFKKKPETFRTVISLWEPLKSLERDDEPCLITIHPRVRNGVLDMFAYIRTNEMYRAWPKNAAGLRLWQLHLANELDVIVGELTITSGSAHIYDYEFKAVDQYLKRNRIINREEDPKGDWIIEKNGTRYIAKHIYQGEIIQVLEAKNPHSLERKLMPFVSDISHAMYLGRQIALLDYVKYL